MITMYLSAKSKKYKTPFCDILSNGIAPRYYLRKGQVNVLYNPHEIKVVVVDAVGKRRAEGMLTDFIENGVTKHKPGRPRYDLVCNALTDVDWDPLDAPSFNPRFKNGVIIVDRPD